MAAAFLLLGSPVFLPLSASAMLEAPAFAMGLLGALLLLEWTRETRRWWLLIASGAVFGLALQTKLTVALLAPALAAEVLFTGREMEPNRWMSRAARALGNWGAAGVGVFLVIGLTLGRGGAEMSLRSHFSTTVVSAEAGSPWDYVFPARFLWMHGDGLLAAGTAILLAVRQRRFREHRFPLLVLATVAVVHAFHRPWWNYYYLHLAIPLAWLGGAVISSLMRAARTLLGSSRKAGVLRGRVAGALVCGIIAVLIAQPERRLEAQVNDLRGKPRASASLIVARLRELRPKVRWVYSDAVIYPFHAGLPVPPQLAVVMPKRFWSGQISTRQIVDACEDLKADALVLRVPAAHEWGSVAGRDYVNVTSETRCALFIRSDLARQRGDYIPETAPRTQ
jgi:4-amino-4-deoxy-L-arabinose transferase-like glycosyltransferase